MEINFDFQFFDNQHVHGNRYRNIMEDLISQNRSAGKTTNIDSGWLQQSGAIPLANCELKQGREKLILMRF